MAFDLISQHYLIAALRHCQVDDAMINIIMALQQSKYYITHHGYESTILLQNGIRQGCTPSPLLWVCVTHYMLYQLSQVTGTDWIPRDLTAFADDFITTFVLNSSQDADRMQQRILATLRVLKQAGMKVNPEKSGILLKLTGSQLRKWMKYRTVQINGTLHLAIGTPFHPVNVPITQSLDYLGICPSYGSLEDLTLKKKKQAARGNVMRLSKFLFSRKGLTLTNRVRMYITCVRSSVLYGLSSVGISKKGFLDIKRFEIRHLRSMARSPRDISHETNQELYARLGIKDCATALRDNMQGRITALESQFYSSILGKRKTDILEWQKSKLA